MKKIRAIIVDDEALARDLIRRYASGIESLDIVAECDNGFDALKAIQDLEPELIFLDIQMPRIDGFELLEVLEKQPQIIFTTAFDQFAIRAFEANAVDYLLKPFSQDRFRQSVDKARLRMTPATQERGRDLEILKKTLDQREKQIERVVVRAGSKIIIIPVDKIYYFEAQDDYVMIYSESGRYLKEKTMKYFEKVLPPNVFVRIHRSFIANLAFIASISLYEKNTHLVVMKDGNKIRASQEGYKKLREML